MSGRSSRSTLMFTNSSFMTRAVASSSNDSWAITWHQWHAEYPTDSRIGLPSRLARSSASGAPRVPVHRVVSVLLQVGAGFLRQAVCRRSRMRCGHGVSSMAKGGFRVECAPL